MASLFKILFILLFHNKLYGEEPNDALAQKAKKILTQNCYSCHGEPGKKVKGGFDSVLDFENLRNNKDYIDTKKPSESELYLRILRDEMPPGKSEKLSAEEKKIILEWISAKLPNVASESKPINDNQGPANHSYVEELIAKDLSKVPENKKSNYRYLSIAHMVGAGDSEKDIDVFRDAMNKLVNSLSFEKSAKPLVAIDEKKLVFRIDLNDYGWNKEKRKDKKDVWDAVAQSNPYKIYANDDLTKKIKKETGTSFPFLRGDWFAIAALQPRFYHQFLNLPETDTELENMLGVDVNKNIANGLAHRAGFTDSGVSSYNRIIERHKSPFGAYWKSYDFGDIVGTSDIMSRPLGAGNGPAEFKHAGGEIIFNLPNGLQAYLLVDANHKRLNIAPVEIVHDTSKLNSTIVNGSSCMSCHSQGMKIKYDKIREHALENKELYSEKDLKQILSLYKDNETLKDAFSEDNNRFIEAMKKSGVQNLTGDEPVRSLTDRFEQRVSLKRAAAELGVTEDTLVEKSKADKEARSIVTRLKDGGGVPREFFVANFNKLKEIIDREVKVEPKKIIEKEVCYETRDVWEYVFAKNPNFKTVEFIGGGHCRWS
jgi:mono/diheme cytochrome c family protein